MDYTIFIVIGVIVLLAVLTVLFLFSRYKKCPSDKLLVVYGALKDKTKAAKIYPGGGVFVWPWIQAFSTMSMLPYKITSEVIGPDSGKVRTHVSVALTTGISNDPQIQLNAVNRFLTSNDETIESQLKLILDGAVRDIIATMDILDLVSNRDKFREQVFETLKPTLSSIGFELINMNIQGIWDDDKYIENSGKKKVTQAAADAEADIADMKRVGEVRKAEIQRDEAVSVAKAGKEQAVNVATAEKEKAVGVADIEKDKTIALATAKKDQEAGRAEQEADQITRVSASVAKGKIAQAEAESNSRAGVAKANADAVASENEALADQEIRIAQAEQKQEAETAKATQEAEARKAEYKSNKEQRQYEAEKAANVKKERAKIEVAQAAAAAGEAEAKKEQTVETAKVEAEMTVAQTRQERQKQVNEAEAEATAAKLIATEIVPAQKAKERAIIDAQKEKAKQVIDAEGYSEARIAKAKADAEAVRLAKEAEARGIEAVKIAEAKGEKEMQIAKATGVQQEALAPAMQFAEMVRAAQEAGGDASTVIQAELAKHADAMFNAQGQQFTALSKANINVYGGESTVADFMRSIVSGFAPGFDVLTKGLADQAKGLVKAFNMKPKTDVRQIEQPKQGDSK